MSLHYGSRVAVGLVESTVGYSTFSGAMRPWVSSNDEIVAAVVCGLETNPDGRLVEAVRGLFDRNLGEMEL